MGLRHRHENSSIIHVPGRSSYTFMRMMYPGGEVHVPGRRLLSIINANADARAREQHIKQCAVLANTCARSARQPRLSVRPGHGFDISHVLRELQEHGVDSGEGWASVSSDKVSILQFTHGQSNPTFLLDFDGMHKACCAKSPWKASARRA